MSPESPADKRTQAEIESCIEKDVAAISATINVNSGNMHGLINMPLPSSNSNGASCNDTPGSNGPFSGAGGRGHSASTALNGGVTNLSLNKGETNGPTNVNSIFGVESDDEEDDATAAFRNRSRNQGALTKTATGPHTFHASSRKALSQKLGTENQRHRLENHRPEKKLDGASGILNVTSAAHGRGSDRDKTGEDKGGQADAKSGEDANSISSILGNMIAAKSDVVFPGGININLALDGSKDVISDTTSGKKVAGNSISGKDGKTGAVAGGNTKDHIRNRDPTNSPANGGLNAKKGSNLTIQTSFAMAGASALSPNKPDNTAMAAGVEGISIKLDSRGSHQSSPAEASSQQQLATNFMSQYDVSNMTNMMTGNMMGGANNMMMWGADMSGHYNPDAMSAYADMMSQYSVSDAIPEDGPHVRSFGVDKIFCLVCRRKFGSAMQFRMHEGWSQMHKENLTKLVA